MIQNGLKPNTLTAEKTLSKTTRISYPGSYPCSHNICLGATWSLMPKLKKALKRV